MLEPKLNYESAIHAFVDFAKRAMGLSVVQDRSGFLMGCFAPSDDCEENKEFEQVFFHKGWEKMKKKLKIQVN